MSEPKKLRSTTDNLDNKEKELRVIDKFKRISVAYMDDAQLIDILSLDYVSVRLEDWCNYDGIDNEFSQDDRFYGFWDDAADAIDWVTNYDNCEYELYLLFTKYDCSFVKDAISLVPWLCDKEIEAFVECWMRLNDIFGAIMKISRKLVEEEAM